MRIQTPAPTPTDADMTQMIVEGLKDPQTVYEIFSTIMSMNPQSAAAKFSEKSLAAHRRSLRRNKPCFVESLKEN